MSSATESEESEEIGGMTGNDAPASGYDDMVSTFLEAGLAAPPVPPSLRDRVALQTKWTWATQPVSGALLYDAKNVALEFARTPSAFAVGNIGHGMNSYAMTYVLGYAGIGVVSLVGWGGIYMDSDRQAQALASRFDQITRLIERSGFPGADGRRLLVLQSAWSRHGGSCGWVEEGSALSPEWIEEHVVIGEDPFDLALAMLS